MKKKDLVIVQYRDVGDDSIWKLLFHNGNWHKWKAYREQDVERTLIVLRRKWKDFEFRIKP